MKRFGISNVLWRTEQGQTVSEYTLILTVVLLLAVTALHYIGTQALELFNRAARALR